MIEPPWDELDEGIRPVVRILHDAQLEPLVSCQGGPGHSEETGWVKLKADSLEDAVVIGQLAGVALTRAGIGAFNVSVITWHTLDGLQRDHQVDVRLII